jgi:hypothetical protein
VVRCRSNWHLHKQKWDAGGRRSQLPFVLRNRAKHPRKAIHIRVTFYSTMTQVTTPTQTQFYIILTTGLEAAAKEQRSLCSDPPRLLPSVRGSFAELPSPTGATPTPTIVNPCSL